MGRRTAHAVAGVAKQVLRHLAFAKQVLRHLAFGGISDNAVLAVEAEPFMPWLDSH